MAESIYDIALELDAAREGSFFGELNYEHVGGTPVLGINAAVTVGHGRSTPLAISNMILQTERTARSGFIQQIKEVLS
jgi:glycerol-3-phosphate acyltransferase PlsX